MENNEIKFEKRFFTVKEFQLLLDGVVTRSMIYKMITAGEVPIRKIGRKIVIPADWVNAYINAPCFTVKKTRRKEQVI